MPTAWRLDRAPQFRDRRQVLVNDDGEWRVASYPVAGFPPVYTNRGPLSVSGFLGQRAVRQLFQTPTGSRQAMQTIRPALRTTRCSMKRV